MEEALFPNIPSPFRAFKARIKKKTDRSIAGAPAHTHTHKSLSRCRIVYTHGDENILILFDTVWLVDTNRPIV